MQTYQRPPAITQTWIYLGVASKLAINQIQKLTVLNQDLVLWRSASGQISVLNAYCTHLGAHLGNGKVCGEMIECNFHKRKFDSLGFCGGKGKNTAAYPIKLFKGLIFAWFGKGAPTWELPNVLQGFNPIEPHSDWEIFKSKKLTFDFHPKELLDNTVDAVHFKSFHRQCESYLPIEIIKITDALFLSKATFLGYPALAKRHIDFKLELVTETHGPSNLVVNGTATIKGKAYYYKFIFLCTPTTGVTTEFNLMVALKTDPALSRWERAVRYLYTHQAFNIQVREFVAESKKIWLTKTHLAHPDYLAIEQPMQQFNQWYSRFYVKSEQEVELTTVI